MGIIKYINLKKLVFDTMASKRYVFKFFASIGPGGSWASLTE